MDKLINIEKAFRQTRLLVLLFMLLASGICGYVIFTSFRFAERQKNKIYVLDNGNSLLLALSKDMNENRPVEAKDHVKNFHKLFFTLDPDPKAIETNIEQALFLCDESAKKEYGNLSEKGYYSQIISGNISQSIDTDSVTVDFSTYPYTAVYYGTQNIIRSSSITKRKLITQCFLRNVTRTDNNPHGFLMERWEVRQNVDISSSPR